MEPTTDMAGIVSSVVRFLLGGVAGALALKGVITEAQAQYLLAFAASAAATGIGIAWIWIKTKAAQKLEQKQLEIARAASPSTPIEQIKTEAKASVAQS